MAQVETQPKGEGLPKKEPPLPIDDRIHTLEEQRVEVVPEEAKEPEIDWKAKAEEERKAREKAEAKAKDLSARLTRTQQESAELYRFHKETLPKINKTFVEQWEESPERAIETKVEERTTNTERELRAVKAQQAILLVKGRHADFDAVAPRMAELANDPEYSALSWTEKGLEALYRMVKAEDLETKTKKLEEEVETGRTKSRAFSEESSAKTQAPAQKVKLTPAQLKVCEGLGVSPEEYIRRLQNG